MKKEELPTYMTRPEVMEYLGIKSKKTMIKLAQPKYGEKPELPCLTLGVRICYLPSDVAAYVTRFQQC